MCEPAEHESQGQRTTHRHVVGSPGRGKSKAMDHMICLDIQFGRAVTVIDPHDLTKDREKEDE